MARDNELKADTDKQKKDPASAGEITKVWTPHPEKQADLPINPRRPGIRGKEKPREKGGK
jgi:hypothetical protein